MSVMCPGCQIWYENCYDNATEMNGLTHFSYVFDAQPEFGVKYAKVLLQNGQKVEETIFLAGFMPFFCQITHFMHFQPSQSPVDPKF